MKMLYLFFSLVALQLLLASPIMVRKLQTENGVDTVSSEINKTASKSTELKAHPFLFMQEQNASSRASSLRHNQVKSRDDHAQNQIRGYSSKRAKSNSPAKKTKQAIYGCRKEDLLVNSSDLGLSASFIRPESFNAYQCRGKCSLTQGKAFTPHKLLEAFVNKKGIKIDDGCCVPTKLKALSVLYYVEERGFFEMDTFQDLIIEECGCY